MLLRLMFVTAVLRTHGFDDVLRFNGDTIEYYKLAAGLAETGRYGAGGVEMNVIGLVRVPVYPLVLAGFLKLASLGLGNSAAVAGLFLMQAAGDALLAALAGLLAWQVWRRRGAAYLAAGLMAMDATGIGLTATILTDGPFALLLCGALLLMLRAARSARAWPAAAAGLLFALATLTKPTPLLLPAILPLAWWLASRRSAVPRRASLRNLAVCLCLFVLPPTAWAARNKVVRGVATVSAVTDRNVRFMIGPEAELRGVAGGGRVPSGLVAERYWQLAHEDDRWLHQTDMTAAEFLRLQREYNRLLLTNFPGSAATVYAGGLESNVVGHWDVLFRQLPVAGTPGVEREGFAPATGYAGAVRALVSPLFAVEEVKLLRWLALAALAAAPLAYFIGRKRTGDSTAAVLVVIVYLVLTAGTTHSQGSRTLYPAHALVAALVAGLPPLAVGVMRCRGVRACYEP